MGVFHVGCPDQGCIDFKITEMDGRNFLVIARQGRVETRLELGILQGACTGQS